MVGHSCPKDGVVTARLHPAIHVFRAARCKDVDARDKPGHDELRVSIAAATGLRYRYFPKKETAGNRHDRLRPRTASHGARTALVRGFRARRALRDPEPDPDLGGVRRVPDREWRHPSNPLRRRILPRPRHAGPARAWVPDPGPHRPGRRTVSLYRRGIAGRISRTIEQVLKAGLCRRHHLPRARSHRTRPRP